MVKTVGVRCVRYLVGTDLVLVSRYALLLSVLDEPLNTQRANVGISSVGIVHIEH